MSSAAEAIEVVPGSQSCKTTIWASDATSYFGTTVPWSDSRGTPGMARLMPLHQFNRTQKKSQDEN
eukprot:m.469752 g.469752  ORF g.469752 m.469752 type:complete len:66 (-) comp29059_c0_seq1:255-452(-)